MIDSKYDYNILVGQFARLRYCHDKTQEIREKELVVETKTYEKINKDCKLTFEEQKESDITKAKQNNEFMELGYIEYKNNIYVPNVNPLNPKNFFNYKIYSDNLTGTITLELEYKDYKNRSVKYFLYEELTTCEFSTRSKKEVIEENEKKIKIQKENFKRTGKMY